MNRETLTANDGTLLHLRRKPALSGTARGRVLLVHGLGEHSGRYVHVADAFNAGGLETWSYDHRGHGRSAGRRGDIITYAHLLDDLDLVVARTGGARNLFLFGHSFGGQIALSWLITRKAPIAGILVSAPWLRLALHPPAWKLTIARLASRWFPMLRLPTGIDETFLSRDPAFLRSLDPDNLVHRVISVRAFYQGMQAAAEVLQKAPEIEAPLFVLHGENDQLIDIEGSRLLHEHARSRDKTLWIVPGAAHETHNDLTRDEVLARLTKWIQARSPNEDRAQGNFIRNSGNQE
jgi:acylglycerol lipase